MLIRWYKTLIMPVLCNGSVTWTLTQMTEQMPCTFESTILRRIYSPIQDKRRWRPRRSSEIYNVHRVLNIVDDIKIRRIGWAGHVARMEDERVLMGNFIIRDQWWNQEQDGRTRLEGHIVRPRKKRMERDEQKTEKNGGVLWGRPRLRRGCSAIGGMDDLHKDFSVGAEINLDVIT
jgi:hypothetical protein